MARTSGGGGAPPVLTLAVDPIGPTRSALIRSDPGSLFLRRRLCRRASAGSCSGGLCAWISSLAALLRNLRRSSRRVVLGYNPQTTRQLLTRLPTRLCHRIYCIYSFYAPGASASEQRRTQSRAAARQESKQPAPLLPAPTRPPAVPSRPPARPPHHRSATSGRAPSRRRSWAGGSCGPSRTRTGLCCLEKVSSTATRTQVGTAGCTHPPMCSASAGGGERARSAMRRSLTSLFCSVSFTGNIMVTSKGDIALVDFGQTKQITPEMRLNLARVMVMLANCGKQGCSFQARTHAHPRVHPRAPGGTIRP